MQKIKDSSGNPRLVSLLDRLSRYYGLFANITFVSDNDCYVCLNPFDKDNNWESIFVGRSGSSIEDAITKFLEEYMSALSAENPIVDVYNFSRNLFRRDLNLPEFLYASSLDELELKLDILGIDR